MLPNLTRLSSAPVGGRADDVLRFLLDKDPAASIWCNICQEQIKLADTKSWTAACEDGHIFHTACLKRWFASAKPTCPACRAPPTAQALDETGAKLETVAWRRAPGLDREREVRRVEQREPEVRERSREREPGSDSDDERYVQRGRPFTRRPTLPAPAANEQPVRYISIFAPPNADEDVPYRSLPASRYDDAPVPYQSLPASRYDDAPATYRSLIAPRYDEMDEDDDEEVVRYPVLYAGR